MLSKNIKNILLSFIIGSSWISFVMWFRGFNSYTNSKKNKKYGINKNNQTSSSINKISIIYSICYHYPIHNNNHVNNDNHRPERVDARFECIQDERRRSPPEARELAEQTRL